MEPELQNSWLVGKLVARSMWWHDLEFLLVCLLFLHLVLFKKVWSMLLGFSCDDTCLSWIEFIFDLSMRAYILVYLGMRVIEYVMEDMVMVILAYILMWYSYRFWWLSWYCWYRYWCLSWLLYNVVFNDKLTCK